MKKSIYLSCAKCKNKDCICRYCNKMQPLCEEEGCHLSKFCTWEISRKECPYFEGEEVKDDNF